MGTSTSHARARRAGTAALLALLVLPAACGGPATVEDDGGSAGVGGAAGSEAPGGVDAGGGEAADDPSSAALEEVYAAVEGLDVDARREALIELAQEAGPLNLYASTNPDDAEVQHAQFTELTGVDIEHYRGNASAIRNRMLQEFEAGQPGADAIVMDGTEMAAIDAEGLLLPLETPYLEDYPDSAIFGNWAAPTSNAYVATWNTDALAGEAIPSSWREILQYDGPWAIEIGDYDWFATLVMDHFVAEEGMTEEEAVELFRSGVGNATPVDGHTLLVELLIAGEFDVVSSAYHHRVRSVIAEDGAPIGWDQPTAVEPVVLRPSGVAIARGADNPAAALLFADFLLSPEGQQSYVDLNRTPNSTTIEGGISPDIETVPVAMDAVVQDREKWESLYEDIVAGAGEEVRGE